MSMKKMPYSLYKNYYNQFHAEEYDSKTKTIMVDIPSIKRKQFPKEWKRDGNHYFTPGGCEVCFWSSGLAENFVVTRNVSAYQRYTKTIYPGIDARDKVIETVRLFESK